MPRQRQVSTRTFGYNEHGELITETDARLITTNRTVDALDRATLVDYPDDTLNITYTYDDPLVPFSVGRLTAIGRNGTSVDYRYDRFGRITQDGVLTFSYDKNGNRSTIGYLNSVTTATTYDFADRPETLDASLPGLGNVAMVTATSYLPSGPVDSLALGNGIVETRLHDQRYHPNASLPAHSSIGTTQPTASAISRPSPTSWCPRTTAPTATKTTNTSSPKATALGATYPGPTT